EISSNVPKPKKNSKGKQNKRGQPLLIDYRGPENRNLVTEDDEDLDGATASTATPSSASAWSPNARPLVSSQAPARQRPPDQGPTDKSEKVDMLVSMTCCSALRAEQLLAGSGWDLEKAADAYFRQSNAGPGVAAATGWGARSGQQPQAVQTPYEATSESEAAEGPASLRVLQNQESSAPPAKPSQPP
ncbi:unnamed protein product, partial [Polarella glacialis]